MIARRACLVALSLWWCGAALAQARVRTQTIRPPAPQPGTAASDAAQSGPPPEIMTDLARLPPAVVRTRAHILEAARSGELEKLLVVMQSNETLPVFSFGDE